jgi:flagellar hook-associated protein FlgK
MPSSFMGLYVQREALLSAQKSLDVTGNNLSNINTKGYTRQRVDMASVPNAKSSLSYNTSVSLAGQGSNVVGVAQVRDALLDKKFRNYTSDYKNSDTKRQLLAQLEDALDNLENEDTGFMSIVAKLKSSLQSYSSDNADRKELGTIVMNNAKQVTDMLKAIDSRINDISEQTLSEAQYAVKDVNNKFSQLAELNKAIKDSYINMGYTKITNNNYAVMSDYGPLELKDTFNQIIDELSEYGDVETIEQEDGSYIVKFAGKVAVSGNQYSQVAVRDDDFAIPAQVTDTGTALTDEQKDELANPQPMDLQLVILDEGIQDKRTGKYSGLRDVDQWRELGLTLGKQNKTIEDFMRGDPEITLDVNARDPKDAKVAREWAGRTITDITKNGIQTNIQTGVTNGSDYGIEKGSLRGLIDLYNGSGSFVGTAVDPDTGLSLYGTNSYQGLEYFRGLIDSLADTFADEMNAIFNGVNGGTNWAQANAEYAANYAGVNLYPDGTEMMLITYDVDDRLPDNGVENVKGAAASLNISQFWQDYPQFVANPDFTVNAANGAIEYPVHTALDNQWINKMIGSFETKHFYPNFSGTSGYTFEEYISHYGNELGNRISYEEKMSGTTEVMLLSVTDARDEVSGTSIDEEGINMMNYQKWYNAIARMTTTMDEALDKLINGTGLVGR